MLQGYPSVVPRASEARYPEVDPQRSTYGCPFYDTDLDWARDQAVSEIGGMVKAAAARATGAEYLALNAFQGHEICAKTDARSAVLKPPGPTGERVGAALSPSSIRPGRDPGALPPQRVRPARARHLPQAGLPADPGTVRLHERPGQ